MPSAAVLSLGEGGCVGDDEYFLAVVPSKAPRDAYRFGREEIWKANAIRRSRTQHGLQ